MVSSDSGSVSRLLVAHQLLLFRLSPLHQPLTARHQPQCDLLDKRCQIPDFCFCRTQHLLQHPSPSHSVLTMSMTSSDLLVF
ncbi:hypothetical protein LshimejAT787_0409990 [Lyophyllum shimeji]|uniref:Uncharacterized protein n=1 Tax=Lyophyllum shimeji TaxID=47721 RepID=A0A9P3PL63_LYOSH|nr:hypothetical protein LshimejAT787_0409990 [Lyophyllum shimeji]